MTKAFQTINKAVERENHLKTRFGKLIFCSFGGFLLLATLLNLSPAFAGETRDKYLKQQEHYADLFRAGDTNCPLLEMDWFEEHRVHFCHVSPSGKGSAGRDVGYAIQAGNAISLDNSNLNLLIQAINELPPPPKRDLPVERQIAIGCIQSNQWFHAIYDRADIPKAVETLAVITGSFLPWHVKIVQGDVLVRPQTKDFSGKLICVASDAAVAVMWGQRVTNGAYYFPGEIQVWSFGKPPLQLVPPLKVISGEPQWGHCGAITPDGTIIALATQSGLYAVDWKSGKLLWNAPPLDDDDSYIGKELAVGDNGRTLYTAAAHTVERWDLVNGKKLGVLATSKNEDIVKFLKVSQNGKVLLAGFGGYNSQPSSFAVWQSGKDEPALRFDEPGGAFADLSPDGEQIALSKFGRGSIVLLNWRSGERKEIPLRNSSGNYAVYWSPNGTRLAAYVNTYPASAYIYETTTWKPIAHWECGRIGEGSEFIFRKDGVLLQLRANEIDGLDVKSLKDNSY